MPNKRKLDREAAAAWLLKASPRVFDVEAAIADGVPPFDSWRLAWTYRVDLLAIDDPVVLWISGPERGIRAAGLVRGRPFTTQGGSQ